MNNLDKKFNYLQHLICWINSSLEGVESAITPQSVVQFVAATLLAKATKTARAIETLANLGYQEDAAVLVRTLFEGFVDLKLIIKNPAKKELRSCLFSYFGVQKELQYLDQCKLAGDKRRSPNRHQLQDAKDTLKNRIKSLDPGFDLERYLQKEGKQGWWKSISKRAKLVHLSPLYTCQHAEASRFVHPNIWSSKQYLEHVPNTRQYRVYTKPRAGDIQLCDRVVYFSTVSLYNTLVLTATELGFSAKLNSSDLRRKFEELYPRVMPTQSGKQGAREEGAN
jgi:hypothetical protein